jgi:sugar O-acyltransferase (sialic acid O-acetyltransferase NeuD family)
VTASSSPKLVLAGDSKLAEMAFEYFSRDSPYEVVAFAVEEDHRERDTLFGLPVVAFESVEERYDPAEHYLHVAVAYRLLNRVRARLVSEAKGKGYRLASYLSSNARVWPDVRLGEHHFIIEDNVIQPFVRIGNNVVIMGANGIGHHSTIGDNCFISSHVIIAGTVELGENCFVGINASLVNDIKIGCDAWIGPHVVVTHDVEPGSVFRPAPSELRRKSSLEMFEIQD